MARSEYERLAWRIATDFPWVCENLLVIRDKSAEHVPFRLNRVQRWVLWNIADQEGGGEPVRLWILKGRQRPSLGSVRCFRCGSSGWLLSRASRVCSWRIWRSRVVGCLRSVRRRCSG